MPTYDYQCRACGAVTEVIHSMLEDGPSTCERCGGELRRVLYPTGIIFKGAGFYTTDSRPSGSNGGGGSSAAEGSTTSADTGGTKKADTGGTKKADTGGPKKTDAAPT